GTWLTALRDLATRALRAPDRVLGLLSDLAPMGPVGPVGLDEVRLVLTRHLSELSTAPGGRPAGRIWVGSVDDARGRDFDVVFVPGLHEKSFPQRLIEDPLLLDRVRVALRAATGARLELNADRAAAERLRLRLAIGATSERLVISWSRLDADKGRPRVPSFYGLEVLRAAEGRLPGFDELSLRAERGEARRLGWPAPDDPARAIDAAEYDLAVLHGLISGRTVGADGDGAGLASYLVSASPHLARALRAHARRELRRWTPADGLVLDPKASHTGATQAALDRHGLALRAYSATALQKWADCPYQFALYALHKLAPREVPEPLERLDPRQRGSLFHDVQFELLQRLRDADRLPLGDDPAALEPALALLDTVLAEVAGRYADELAPAIERVWEDGLAAIRADLRGWLRQLAADRDWAPHRFELSFGLPGRRAKDPASTDAPVQLDVGVRLRGAIDLVERAADGTLRATDHKTGRPRGTAGMVIGGGLHLQPVLYALALEQLVPDAPVAGGRLWYCTERAGWEDRVIPLDERARDAASRLATAIDDSVVGGFLPAYPRADGRYNACTWCDYATICGPDEVQRTKKKPKREVERLIAIREEP
ncbi:MAG: PD-(D/E)XK nuclease family protein, partial [Deltaproteobacteria bacterium]